MCVCVVFVFVCVCAYHICKNRCPRGGRGGGGGGGGGNGGGTRLVSAGHDGVIKIWS